MSTFAISFEKHASAIIKAAVAAGRAQQKASEVLHASVNSFLDAARAAGIKPDQAACEALGEEIKGCAAIKGAIEIELFEKKTWDDYARGAQRAFFHGVPWAPGTFKDASLALPWSKPRGPKAGAKTEAKTTGAKPLPAAPDMGTQSTEEIRAFVQGQARTLLAYLNKHLANADLPTRDCVQHFARAAEKLPAPK